MSISSHGRRLVRGASLTFLGSLTAHTAIAQDEPPADDPSVIVTASRVEERVEDTLMSTTVITREDIEARQPSSVQDLLSSVAGIDIGNNGGLGKLSSIFIRGAESDHTLLLVDGVRMASATAGTPAVELIPVEQIDRIEIVRGPRSTLYGTDAIGGVIQIFTKHARASNGLSFGAEAGGGSHNTQTYGASFAARGDRAWLSLGAESFDTNGYNSCASAAGVVFAACFVDEPDADGFRNNSGTLAAGYSFNDSWKAQVTSLFADGRSEYDGSIFGGNETEFTGKALSLSLDGALSKSWNVRLTAGRNEDHQHYFYHDTTGTVPTGIINTDRNTASVQLDGKIGNSWRLISGVDHQHDEVDSDTPYDVDSRNTTGVFGELHGAFGPWSALAGARYEDNQQFGDHVVGNVALGRALANGLKLTASWGTAFHAPTFNELYYPGFSNPDLKPEESKSFEVGLSGRVAPMRFDWSLNVFQTDIDQLVGFDSNFAIFNIAKSRIRGAELRGEWRNEQWRANGQFTHLNPRNRTDDLLLQRRSKENASIELHRLWPSLSVGTLLRYQGKRFDDPANLRPLDSYVTADLMASASIGKSFELQGKVANLFDKDYETAAYYLQDGRNYSVTLRYRFDTGR